MNSINSNDSESEIEELIDWVVAKKKVLKQHRDALEREIQEIDAELVSYEVLVKLVKKNLNSYRNHESMFQNGVAVAPLDLSKKGKYAYMTVSAALVCFYYERENKESSISHILDYVTENGLEIGGKDPLANLTAVLHADQRFEAIKRGIYRLKPEVFQNLKESGLKLRLKVEEVK
jgi:hypothetical protein